MQQEKKTTVYIGNLSYKRNEKGITKLFAPFGPVKYVKLLKVGKQDQSKGVAFVEMANAKDADRAILALNGKVVDDRTLKVSRAIPHAKKKKKIKKS